MECIAGKPPPTLSTSRLASRALCQVFLEKECERYAERNQAAETPSNPNVGLAILHTPDAVKFL